MRSISKTFLRISCLCLALLFLCGNAQASSDLGDTLDLGMISVKTTFLNPLLSEEREFQSLTALMYEGLFSLDDNYRPQPCLAESCSQSGTKWTITMRQDVTFSDGTPCTAYDVAATIEQIFSLAEEGRGQYTQLKYIISDVKANDATSLTLTMNRSYYGSLFALTFPVLPQNQVNDLFPLGTGPYKADAFQPGDYFYLSANPYWWQGVPSIPNINVHFNTTNRKLIEDYELNLIDAAISRSASAGQYQTGLTNLNLSYRTRQLEVLLMNHRPNSFPLDDIRVRQAISYAIDIDAVANAVYAGTAERVDTPMPYGTWMYDDSITHEYNPDKARQILADAGWGDSDGDGMLDQIVDGKPRNLKLQFHVYEEQDNTVRTLAAQMISDMLAAVGIKAGDGSGNVTTITYARAKERLAAGNFDLMLCAFQMDVVPDPGFLLMSNNTGNFGAYKSTAMDNLFKDFRKASDPEEYQSLLYQIQQQFIADCPFLCLYYRCGALLTRKVFTTERDIREPEILRGIESVGK